MRIPLTVAVVLLGFAAGGAQALDSTIVTGKPTGTYIRFGQEIAGVAKHFGIDLSVAPSAGSLENVEAVVKRPNTQLGIVQSDVLDFITTFSDDPDLRTMSRSMRMVFPLYDEEVHLVARQGIDSLADLNGKRVAVGAPDSGTSLTATLMLAADAIDAAEEVQIDAGDALPALRNGEIDAFFYVAGRPARLFAQDVTEADGLHLVPITDPNVLAMYGRAVIPAGTYRWQPTDVPTVAVRAVLMTYDFSKPTWYQREACSLVGKVARMIADNLDWLKAPGRGHPKWQEVGLDASMVHWQRSSCAEAGLNGAQAYKLALQPATRTCTDEPNGIRRKLCQVREQMRQPSIGPSANLM